MGLSGDQSRELGESHDGDAEWFGQHRGRHDDYVLIVLLFDHAGKCFNVLVGYDGRFGTELGCEHWHHVAERSGYRFDGSYDVLLQRERHDGFGARNLRFPHVGLDRRFSVGDDEPGFGRRRFECDLERRGHELGHRLTGHDQLLLRHDQLREWCVRGHHRYRNSRHPFGFHYSLHVGVEQPDSRDDVLLRARCPRHDE